MSKQFIFDIHDLRKGDELRHKETGQRYVVRYPVDKGNNFAFAESVIAIDNQDLKCFDVVSRGEKGGAKCSG